MASVFKVQVIVIRVDSTYINPINLCYIAAVDFCLVGFGQRIHFSNLCSMFRHGSVNGADGGVHFIDSGIVGTNSFADLIHIITGCYIVGPGVNIAAFHTLNGGIGGKCTIGSYNAKGNGCFGVVIIGKVRACCKGFRSHAGREHRSSQKGSCFSLGAAGGFGIALSQFRSYHIAISGAIPYNFVDLIHVNAS